MNGETRAPSVHPSRHYGYTHNDAHAAFLEVDAPVEIDLEAAIGVDGLHGREDVK